MKVRLVYFLVFCLFWGMCDMVFKKYFYFVIFRLILKSGRVSDYINIICRVIENSC